MLLHWYEVCFKYFFILSCHYLQYLSWTVCQYASRRWSCSTDEKSWWQFNPYKLIFTHMSHIVFNMQRVLPIFSKEPKQAKSVTMAQEKIQWLTDFSKRDFVSLNIQKKKSQCLFRDLMFKGNLSPLLANFPGSGNKHKWNACQIWTT